MNTTKENFCSCSFTVIQRTLDGKAYCFQCGNEISEAQEVLPATEEAPLQDNLEDTELGKRFIQILKDYNNGYGATIEETAHALVETTLTQVQEVRDKEEIIEGLRNSFEKETGIPVTIQLEPDIDYVSWLENKIAAAINFISTPQPASNETPVKEEGKGKPAPYKKRANPPTYPSNNLDFITTGTLPPDSRKEENP